MDMPTFLVRYGFELAQQDPEAWIADWSRRFPPHWIPMALLEALYQGRYKAASVEQLLLMWRRRGEPRLGFAPEFSHKIWPDQPISLVPDSPQDPPLPAPRVHPFLSDPCPISTQDLLVELQPLSPKLQRLIQSTQGDQDAGPPIQSEVNPPQWHTDTERFPEEETRER